MAEHSTNPHSERSRGQYLWRKESGVCTRCGGDRDGDGLKCLACAAKHRAVLKTTAFKTWKSKYRKREYLERKTDGLCIACGRRSETVRVRCIRCSGPHTEGIKASHHKRQNDGCCVNCGNKREPGLAALCQRCCEKSRPGVVDWTNRNWAHVKEHQRHRRKNEIQYRLSCALRTRLGTAMQDYLKGTRKKSAVRDLGCTLGEFCAYLEGLFASGMTWDNYGEWQIDHIKPLMSFDLSDPKQQAGAVHFTNLQPLWARDNIAKRNRDYAALRGLS